MNEAGSGRISFRPLVDDDIPMQWEWLNRPHVAEWWRGEQSIEQVRETYLPRILGDSHARPFVAVLDGDPFGYIQVYIAAAGDPAWWPDEPGPGVRGIDQFIAAADLIGRGLGAAMVAEFVREIMRDETVTEVRVDPRPDNARAIRCYEKAGFRRIADITTPDGPAVWMSVTREDDPGSQGNL